ncbi:MAG: SprT family zinc-dependent metalloprotease [Collinsella sp.]|nr:SprT family zinc-dependent metalloprotease [Collinsella sp.]
MAKADLIFDIRAGDIDIPVAVTRKPVRNLNLRVRPDGSVALSIPLHTKTEVARAFLERKAPWIASHVERRMRTANGPIDGDPSGADVPLWGRLEDPRAILQGLPRIDGDVGRKDALERLYLRETKRALPPIVIRLEERIGVSASAWTVRHMRSRWGSCTVHARSIRINAQLAAYPPECLEFVVAHELIHLIEPNHGPRFHELLDAHCPDNRSLAALLKRPAIEVARTNGHRAPNAR